MMTTTMTIDKHQVVQINELINYKTFCTKAKLGAKNGLIIHRKNQWPI